MSDDLVTLRIRIRPDVAAWLREEAKRYEPEHVDPETIAAIFVERAVEDKQFQREQEHERRDTST